MKKYIYGCLIALVLGMLSFVGLFVFAVAGGFVDYRLETYELWYLDHTEWTKRQEGMINPMPSLDDLNDAQEIRFQHYYGNFWGSKAYTLIAEYNRERYESAKRLLDETFMFETGMIDQGKKNPQIDPEFTMGRFRVRLLKTGDLPYAAEVPKHMYFAGTADDTCEILYIYYHDVDLDLISESFEKVLPELIHWSSIDWIEKMPYLKDFSLPVLIK